MVIEKQKPVSKIRKFFSKLGKRNIIIALAVIAVGVAVCVNWVILANRNDAGYQGYKVSSGMSNTYGNVSAGKNESEVYFASTQPSRTRARDEALEVLQSVVDDKQADEASKNAAYNGISRIAKDMENEANIESLIVAKGFSQCVAVINDDKASVVVKSDTALTRAQLSQINEIVYTQAGITPENITIIQK